LICRLVRFAIFKDRTLGRLTYGNLEYFTIERPWLDNSPNVSCIPGGTYPLHRVNSPKFGPGMWEIGPVPNRSHILIHVANSVDDVIGCVGLGKTLYPDLKGVGSSRVAIENFYEATRGQVGGMIEISEGVLR